MNHTDQNSLADIVTLMTKQSIQNILNGEVSAAQWLTLAIYLIFFAGVFFKGYSWLEAGGLYYAKYPAAKQMDDLKQQGKLTRNKSEEIIKNAGKFRSL